MLKALTLFPTASTQEAIDDTLAHMVISLKNSPGYISAQVSDGFIMSPGGPPPYSKVVEFSFDSLENFMVWAQSQDAQAKKESMIKYQPVMLYYEVKDLDK